MDTDRLAGAIQALVELVARLRGPDGCPWDRKQTPRTIKSYLLEETHEALFERFWGIRVGQLRDVALSEARFFLDEYRDVVDVVLVVDDRVQKIIVSLGEEVEEAKATILLFSSMLNEQQRRLYAGLESLKLGHGGDIHIASLLGMDPHTVSRGRQELVNADCGSDAVRASGGGRLSQEKKRLK